MNKLSEPSHPIWKILRLAVLCIAAIAFLSLNYKHGLVPKDFGTVVGLLTSVGAFDYIKSILTKKAAENEGSN